MSTKNTTTWFLKKAKEIYNDKFDYSKSIYTLSQNKIEIICKTHGSFFQTANYHFKGNGCPICNKINKEISIENFITNSNTIHKNKYDYSKTFFKEKNWQIVVIIVCPTHGEFKQRAINHLKGGGCKKCGIKKRSISHTKTQENFIKQANQIHNNLYDYSKTKYNKDSEKVEIICLKHGSFWQRPSCHIHSKRPSGCPTCGGTQLKTIKQFISQANAVHNNLYDYSLVEYTKGSEKIKIICLKHGIFVMAADSHLEGYKCAKCANKISKLEIKWLDSLSIPEEFRQKYLKMSSGKKYEVDAYDPNTNTVYEFNGDYWHGNPAKFNPTDVNPKMKKTYGELYQKTLNREKDLKENGYNTVFIWESDFKLKIQSS